MVGGSGEKAVIRRQGVERRQWQGGLVGLCPERKSRSRVYSYPLQPTPKEAGTGRQEKLPEWVFQWAPKAGVMGPLLT